MVQRQKKSKVRWYFAIAFFIIGVIAYMDRSNISFIAPQMMEDLHMTKQQFGLLASFFSGLCIDASPFRYVSREVWSA